MKKILLSVGMLCLWSVPVLGATTPGHDAPYAQALFNYEFPDSGRDSGNGIGVQLGAGYPLTRFGLSHSSAEFNWFGTQRSRNIDGKDDYQNAFLFDYVYDFGLFGWGPSLPLPNFKPYVLGGLGLVREDVRGHVSNHPALDAGGGVLVPLPFMGWAVRAEFRVIGQQNHRSVASQDFLFDYHVGIGLQIPLDFLGGASTSAPSPAEPEVKVVPVAPAEPAAPPPPPPNGDSDGDGVPDAADQCPDTPPGIKVDAKGCPVSQVAVFKSVQFMTASAQLTDDAKATLDGVAKAINEQPNLSVEIGGHTDNVGNAAFNQKLSEQRAESVRQYLISKGVSPGRLKSHGYGSSQPVASNDSAAGRAENRRVEFKIIVD